MCGLFGTDGKMADGRGRVAGVALIFCVLIIWKFVDFCFDCDRCKLRKEMKNIIKEPSGEPEELIVHKSQPYLVRMCPFPSLAPQSTVLSPSVNRRKINQQVEKKSDEPGDV